MYAMIIDGILILIFTLSMINGIRHGLIKSLSGFFITLASFIISGLLADFFSSVVYTLFFEQTIHSTIINFFSNGNFSNIINLNFSGTFASFLNFIKNCIAHGNYQIFNIKDIELLFKNLTMKILRPAMIAVFYMIIRTVFGIILKSTQTRPVKFLDNILGAIIGALKGAFLVVIVVISIEFLAPILNGKYKFLSKKELSTTVIYYQIKEKIILNKKLPSYNFFENAFSINQQKIN